MIKGKLIVIESGTDASGKATQSRILAEQLAADGFPIIKIEFPNYESPASWPLKMYLNGDFGSDPLDVNAFAASTFFAVDRYASYKQQWQEQYFSGAVIIADRYTTSNMVHQAAKIDNSEERKEFITWLRDFEYGKLGLPEPDLVVFLDVDPQASRKLLEQRDRPKDIHETDREYLVASYMAAKEVAATEGWVHINCVRDGKMRSIAEIHQEIYEAVRNLLT